MALVVPGSSKCPICHEVIDGSRPHVATSGCAFGPDHHLFGYCDAPLHLECLEDWPHRLEFSRAYYHLERGFVLVEARAWMLTCGPCIGEGTPYYASVKLIDWPFTLYTCWDEWEQLIAGGFREGLTGKGLAAAGKVIAEVADLVPDGKALADLLEKGLREHRVQVLPEFHSADTREKYRARAVYANEVYQRMWGGKERSCPKCHTSFASVQDRGCCPSCRHVFDASSLAWLDRERECPECGTMFHAREDRGECPDCGFRFTASVIYAP